MAHIAPLSDTELAAAKAEIERLGIVCDEEKNTVTYTDINAKGKRMTREASIVEIVLFARCVVLTARQNRWKELCQEMTEAHPQLLAPEERLSDK